MKLAVDDYTALQMYRALQDVLFLLSVVYHNLGLEEDRDVIAKFHHDVGQEREEAEKQVSEPWVAEVLGVVSEITLALAARQLHISIEW